MKKKIYRDKKASLNFVRAVIHEKLLRDHYTFCAIANLLKQKAYTGKELIHMKKN